MNFVAYTRQFKWVVTGLDCFYSINNSFQLVTTCQQLHVFLQDQFHSCKFIIFVQITDLLQYFLFMLTEPRSHFACSLCQKFTLIRFLFLTDVASRNYTVCVMFQCLCYIVSHLRWSSRNFDKAKRLGFEISKLLGCKTRKI